MEILKAGCYLINLENKSIGLIYRENYNDYTFPKGHVEIGEDTVTCAIRETAEETKRVASVVPGIKPYEERYKDSKGNDCVCYMYVAIDNGPSDNDSTDTHDLIWTAFDDVENKLSYDSLKKSWSSMKSVIYNILGDS